MELRKQIALGIIDLAEEIAVRHRATDTPLGELIVTELATTGNEGTDMILADTVRGWAMTYLDYLSGAIKKSELSSDDYVHKLMALQLEHYVILQSHIVYHKACRL